MNDTERQDRVLRTVAAYPEVAKRIRVEAPIRLAFGVNAILEGVRPPWTAFDGEAALATIEGGFERAGVELAPGPGVAEVAIDWIEAGRDTAVAGAAAVGIVTAAQAVTTTTVLVVGYKSGILGQVARGIGRLVAWIPKAVL